MSVTVHGATPAPAAKHAALHDPNMSHRLVTSVRAYKPHSDSRTEQRCANPVFAIRCVRLHTYELHVLR